MKPYHCQSPDHEGNRLIDSPMRAFEVREEHRRLSDLHSPFVRRRMVVCQECERRMAGAVMDPGQAALL